MESRQRPAPVLIVGAGPVGLWLARELALAGVRPRIVEREPRPSSYVRAGGLHPRTIELLDMRGVMDRYTGHALKWPYVNFAGLMPLLDLAPLDTAHAFGLTIRQDVVEQITEELLGELGVTVERERTVTAVEQGADAVRVAMEDGEVIEAAYVVGCDGARSLVRKQAGITFPGIDSTATYVLSDVRLDDPPEWLGKLGIKSFEGADGQRIGWFLGGQVPGTDQYRIMIADEPSSRAGKDDPVEIEEVRAILRRIAGSDFGAHSPTCLARVGNQARVADRYRAGRVLLAGDAAHVHSPFGGQGLNTGLQDATNLGWKLAAVVRGESGEELLDTYHDERHPIGERVVANTLAQTRMVFDFTLGGARLRELFSSLMKLPQVNDHLAGMITALDYSYAPASGAHPLVGTRVPDLELKSPDAGRLYELFRDGGHVVLELAAGGAKELDVPAKAQVRVVRGEPSAPREGWDGLDAVLIRPDGHIAAVAPAGS
ncbi:FAD-dependent monooxygenase [Actinomadura litoris]|nr:FAD-dependent monooxygenase [Actinomadura litoris]